MIENPDFSFVQRGSLDLALESVDPVRGLELYQRCYDVATDVLGSGKQYIKGKDGLFYGEFMYQKACYQNYLLKKELER